jgi:hypothetical protein
MTEEEFWEKTLEEYQKSCREWWKKHGMGKQNMPGRQYVYGMVVKQFGYQWLNINIYEILDRLDQVDKDVQIEMTNEHWNIEPTEAQP